jgi:hypothetical protein
MKRLEVVVIIGALLSMRLCVLSPPMLLETD